MPSIFDHRKLPELWLGISIVAFVLVCLPGCKSLQTLVQDESDSNMVNYALASYGTQLYVSKDNSSHPASSLNNGINTSESWDQGEGWSTSYDGPYAYGRYFAYGENTVAAASAALSRERYARLQGEQVNANDFDVDPRNYEETDDNWRGLRGNDMYSGGVQSAFGWVVLEFPERERLTKVVIYTVDSQEYPAATHGVSHVRVQYWTESSIASGWANVDRYNKKVGQKDDSIKDIKSGRVVFRFKPVKTKKIRVAVLWTNDAERYRAFGRRHYSKGTVRLVEVEAYGNEKIASAEEVDESSPDDAQLLLDQILAGDDQPGQTAAADTATIESMEAVVRTYAAAYASGDIGALMDTVVQDYQYDGETRDGLEIRMQRLFERHPKPDFVMHRLETDAAANQIVGHYTLNLDGTQPLSGKLQFTLAQVGDVWKIQLINPFQ